MIPFLILSIRRYCSSHFAGAAWGFSSARSGKGFLLADFGVGGRAGVEGEAGVRGGSSFGFFRGDRDIGGSALASCLIGVGTFVAMDRVERRREVKGVEVSVEGDDGSCLTGVIRVTRGSAEDRFDRNGVEAMLPS